MLCSVALLNLRVRGVIKRLLSLPLLVFVNAIFMQIGHV